jgi:tetratricopeptide (TPR) repeat protein
MSKLKAFVGHSFTTEDEPIVRSFLKFFEQVKDMDIGFTWQHAEPAEPKVLAAKVLGLMEGKNLFIGICTKKEVVIATNRLKKAFFNKDVLKAREEHFSWKTSDWIIQEIGLAKGRGMDLILIVENGLRQPGGLQGDLEYIPFDREAPEKSFGKILEMIHALMPKAAALASEEVDIRSTSEEKQEPKENEGGDRYMPKPEWNRRQFEFALMHTIAIDNSKASKEIYVSYLGTEDGKIQENIESWEAYREYVQLKFGKGGRLARLQEMVKIYPKNSKLQWYLGKGYQEYDDYEKAGACFIAAAEVSADDETQITNYRDAATAFARTGNTDGAKGVLHKMQALAKKVEDGESILLNTVLDIAERADDKDRIFGLTERLLQLHPEDSNARFQLAFKYAETGHHDLALLHYLKIPYQERASGTWNNLGVEFDHFELNYKSVKAYQKAEELGETLAMSNLAQKLIRSGFLSEAESICERAMEIKDYHKNVGYAITRIKDQPEEEEKKENEITLKATPVGEFYKVYGQALIKESIPNVEGIWEGKQCPLNIEIQNGKFKGIGTYEQKTLSGLLGYGLAGLASAQPAKVIKYLIRYDGTVTGHAIKGTIFIEEEGKNKPAASVLELFEKTKDVLMIISDDLTEFRVYEKSASESDRFYSLVKH